MASKFKKEEEEKRVLYNNIPCDFVEDILSRLDAKSLKRCECVSKTWLSLLQTPYFINLHLRRQLPRVVFLHKRVRRFAPTLSICDCENFAEISSHKFPFIEIDCRPPSFMGSDNGVLGLFDLDNSSAYLWNPTINEFKELPPSPQCRHKNSALGLGYDPLTTDFKVVKVSSRDKDRVFGSRNGFKEGCQVGIYSLRSNSWKAMLMPNIFSELESSTSIITVYTSLGCSIVVNECIHWIILYGNTTYYHQPSLGIVAFDTSLEKFKLIESPQFPHIENGSNIRKLKLANFSGCLSLFTLDEVTVVEIWVMKKYGDSDSWFKYLSVNLSNLLSSGVGQHSDCFGVDFLSNGILVISWTETDYWFWYDTKSKRLVNTLPRSGMPDFISYIESTYKLKA
ncbi:F-box protein CPR1-like [Humulus lupulus]|uniref:F-box protein CPR1-like n=1 Tax=Humulus lupulus TaxID=3486 RepID=UPI002B4142B2|nr:F-box protein CPR1-like [Humulus lupulus]